MSDLLDGHSNNGLPMMYRQCDKFLHIILRPGAGAHEVSTAVDKDDHGKACRLCLRNCDVEIQTLSRRVLKFVVRERMLNDGVLYVTGLAGLDRLRAVKGSAVDHVSEAANLG